ncbi:MAG: hypothetical protein Tsb0033_08620 [Winogradskyella sp.]
MKLFPINKDTIALSSTGFVGIGFFAAGLSNVLGYFIIKALLFLGFGILLIVAIYFTLTNDQKKNRPEVKPQDDLH